MLDPIFPTITVQNLERGLAFLADLISARVRETLGEAVSELPQPAVVDDGSPLAALAGSRKPSYDEFTILMLALVPHLRPGLVDQILRQVLPDATDFAQFGGQRDKDSRAVVPTGETAAFLLAGDDLQARFAVQSLFGAEHWFAREHVLSLEPAEPGAPCLSGRIVMARDWVERLTMGRVTAPAFSPAFPAHRIEPLLDWDDLKLEAEVSAQLDEVLRWLRHRQALAERAMPRGRLRPGFRTLFHGPSGTGKTLAAGLLGKVSGRPVYRVDLSTVVSKYIGETEKNLSALFDTAQSRDWVLVFDEADALFGKRTAVRDSHDRYANQEVSYLLQRVEDYDGLVILASNQRANMDDAFLGRFDCIVRFPMPSETERREIWRSALPRDPAPAEPDAFVSAMARFELSGRAIVGALQFAALAALDAASPALRYTDAALGVRREMEKEGRVFKNLVADEEVRERGKR